MSIAITTPTGNIGSVVTQRLLDAGQKPILIARNPARVAEAVARGATVEQGSHDDAGFLTAATRDASALFLLTPSDFGIQDIRGFYGRFATAAAEAVRANGISRVVHLSSVGAELPDGNGPVAGLHEAERILDAAGIPNLTHLRPGYFMENTLGQIPNILQASSLFTTFPTGTRFPMIATRDIGERAAALLLDPDWAGHNVVELHGPETGYDEVAGVLAEVLEREIAHVTVSDTQMIEALVEMGISRVLAESLAELADGITAGHVRNLEPRTAANTAPTSYREFATEVLRPAFAAALGGAGKIDPVD